MAKQRGPYFIISRPEDLLLWLQSGTSAQLYSARKMTKSEQQVLEALAELCPSSWDEPITLDMLLEILKRKSPNVTEATLTNKVRLVASKLTDIKIFKKSVSSPLGGRKQNCYELNKPQKTLELLEKITAEMALKEKTDSRVAESQRSPKALQKAHEAVKASLLTRNDIIYPIKEVKGDEVWSLLLITQLMERCSRETLRDRRDMIETKLQMGDELFDVVGYTSTRADKDIGGKPGLLASSDAQTVLALITIVSQYVDQTLAQNKPLVNRIPLDIVQLMRLLGKDDNGGNRETVIKSLQRIIYTGYTIKLKAGSKAAEMMKQMTGHEASEMDFSLLRDVIVGIEGMDSDITSRRWYTFSLNTYIWESLCKGAGARMVHPKLLQENNGYMQKLHAHIKLHCGTSETIVRTTNQLFQFFGYKGGAGRFKTFLHKTLMQRAGLPENTEIPEEGVWLDFYGYDIHVLSEKGAPGHLELHISMSEEERKRSEEEKRLLGARANEARSQMGLDFEGYTALN